MSYVLDTNVITALLAADIRVFARLATIPSSEVFVTIVSLHEQLRGQLASLNDQKAQSNRPLLVRRYNGFLANASFYFDRFGILPYDNAAATFDEQLQNQKHPKGTMDRRIAAITLAHGYVLATRNTVDFQGVVGLQIEDWMAP